MVSARPLVAHSAGLENHQNIFEDQEDYYQFLNTLDMMAQAYEPDGTPSGRNYILYAYCLMSNHIHLLIREREDNIGMAIKKNSLLLCVLL